MVPFALISTWASTLFTPGPLLYTKKEYVPNTLVVTAGSAVNVLAVGVPTSWFS